MIKGFTAGSWDLLHAGHVIFLQKCKELCDSFVVGLHIDPSIERSYKNKPIQTVFERYIQLRPFCDEIIPYETEKELEYILRVNKYDRRFLGD